jgi:hypothetical protein
MVRKPISENRHLKRKWLIMAYFANPVRRNTLAWTSANQAQILSQPPEKNVIADHWHDR